MKSLSANIFFCLCGMSRVIYRWLGITIPILSQNKEHGSLNWAELQKELIVEGILLYSRSARRQAQKNIPPWTIMNPPSHCVCLSAILFFPLMNLHFEKHTLGRNNGTPMLLTNSYSRHDPLDGRTLLRAEDAEAIISALILTPPWIITISNSNNLINISPVFLCSLLFTPETRS
jgi:hypothetical protein